MDSRLSAINDEMDATGRALDGLAFLGSPGGSAYLRARNEGLELSDGVAEDGSEGVLLLFWDGSMAIASVSSDGVPSVDRFADADEATSRWEGIPVSRAGEAP